MKDKSESTKYLSFRVPPDLHRRAKVAAAMREVSLQALIQDGIERAIRDAGVAP